MPEFIETNDKKTVDPTQLLWHQNIPESLIILGGVFMLKETKILLFIALY